MLLNHVKPSKDQMDKLMGYPKNTPLVMLNILKFKDKTGNENETGKEAYARYFRNARPFIEQSNAKLIWKGAVATTVIGNSEKEPDMIFLIEYPSVDHFLKILFIALCFDSANTWLDRHEGTFRRGEKNKTHRLKGRRLK